MVIVKEKSRIMPNLIIRPATDGYEATIAGKHYPCAIGRSGITTDKREGDGATPAGLCPIREVYYRPDQVTLPEGLSLPAIAITSEMGWSDDPAAPDYNCFIPDTTGYNYSHEKMWRDDHRYDLVINVGYNDNPPIPGKGSAIFIHVTQDYNRPSSGCITFVIEDLLEIVALLDHNSYVDVLA